MTFTALTAAAVFGLASLGPDMDTPKGFHLAQAQPFTSTQGFVVMPGGDYKTTANGCTYRRTQAPGYPARWILVQNPHHVGMGGARGCKGML